MPYLFLFLAFVINAAGSIFLKLDAENGLSLSLKNGLLSAVAEHRFLILGLVAFAVNIIFYWLALKVLPLSVAYPIAVAGSFVIISLWSVFALYEGVTLWQIVGYVLIFAGILLVLLKGANA